jgi:hypothetical protein
MNDTTRFIIGAIVTVLPLLVATYYRGLASTAFRQASTFVPPDVQSGTKSSLANKIVAAFLSTHRKGGPEFFWAPPWLATITHPEGCCHVASFRRYRMLFWLFMAAVPLSFVLVRRLVWT